MTRTASWVRQLLKLSVNVVAMGVVGDSENVRREKTKDDDRNCILSPQLRSDLPRKAVVARQ